MASPDNSPLYRDAEAYIFDIDGTLLNTRDLVHYNALNRALCEVYGADTTIDGISYHGMTDLSILRTSLERMGIHAPQFEARLPEALAAVRREVERNEAKLDPQVCPAVPEVLKRLQQRGKLLGVASGNLESVGWRKLEAAGLRRFFSFGFFSDGCERRAAIFQNAVNEVRARLGATARVCFVGDTPADIEAAREIGAGIISVCTGTFKAQELAALSPDLCLSSCVELLDLV